MALMTIWHQFFWWKITKPETITDKIEPYMPFIDNKIGKLNPHTPADPLHVTKAYFRWPEDADRYEEYSAYWEDMHELQHQTDPNLTIETEQLIIGPQGAALKVKNDSYCLKLKDQ